MSLSRTGSLSCWTAMATMLLWPTMSKLRSGSFVPALLKYENLPDIKGSAVPRSLRETPIRSAAFLVSMTGDACQSGRHCPALRCLFAEAVLLRGTHADRRLRLTETQAPHRRKLAPLIRSPSHRANHYTFANVSNFSFNLNNEEETFVCDPT
jgi:hypothetical protein